MNNKYFENVRTLEELRKQYKESRGYAMTTGSAGGMSKPLRGISRFRL